MSISTYTGNYSLVKGQIDNAAHWCVSVYSADATGAEQVLAASAAGYAPCIESIDIIVQTTTNVWMYQTAPNNILQMPFDATAGGQVHIRFKNPIELVPEVALTMDTTGAAPISVIVQGFTRKIT